MSVLVQIITGLTLPWWARSLPSAALAPDPVRNEREDSQVLTRLPPRRCTGAADGLAQGLQGLLDRVQRD